MPSKSAVTIYVISGGVGASGDSLVNTVLAQFPDSPAELVTVGNVRHTDQIERAIAEAKANDGLIVHTMVDARLRQTLIELAQAQGVPAIDLMGKLIGFLSQRLGQPPLQQPGRYRQHHKAYFDRVAAIEYTFAHDDGKQPEGWLDADVLLVGVSRSGKTPLSVYLSVLGLKTANYPLVPEIPPPTQLFEVDPRRVIGLTIDIDRLHTFRLRRSAEMGIQAGGAYTDPERLQEELSHAKRLFRQGGFYVLNVTDRTVEANADEIIKRISRIE
jgi:hypothetical protein